MRKILIALVLLMSVNRAGASGTDDNARGLFLSRKADALKVSVLKDVRGTMTPVDADQEFKAGDQIQVSFESNFTGYVYIINVTPGGKARILFPQAGVPDNRVHPNQRYELPPGDNRIEFDTESGTERLFVVMARAPVHTYDEAVQGRTELTMKAALDVHVAGVVVASAKRSEVASAPMLIGADIHSRGLFLTTAVHEAYVAVTPAAGNSSGTLGPGQVAVFELHLHHI